MAYAEAIVQYANGQREQLSFSVPVKVGDRVSRSDLPAEGVVVELVCDGCYKYPCECLSDDFSCDPE